MDFLAVGLTADILFGFALFALRKKYLSTINVLSPYHSLHEFYENNVNITHVVEDGVDRFIEKGCEVIVNGDLVSLDTSASNKIFNGIVIWSQSIFEKVSVIGGDELQPRSYWIKCSPKVVLIRKYGWLWTKQESVTIIDPVELDGLERLYEVVVDNFVKQGAVGLRAIDKMIFSGTPVSIRGWLIKNELGNFVLTRDNQCSGGSFQISSKSSHQFSDEINPHKSLLKFISFMFKLTFGIGTVLAVFIVIRRIRRKFFRH